MNAQPEAEPTNTPSIIPPTATTSPTSIYSSLHAYSFDSDPAFLAGLSQIFGHPGIPVTEAELAQKPDLALSAKCFYYSRKFSTPTPINAAGYKSWLTLSTTQNTEGLVIQPDLAQPTTETAQADHPAVSTNTTSPSPAAAPPSTTTAAQPTSETEPQFTPQPPPYPTSFAAIVELITNNKPIPGIEEIPTTVLEAGSSKQDRATRRKKPWEKDSDTAQVTEIQADGVGIATASDAVADELDRMQREEGLLRLLRPDAVPDSGLVAKE